MAGTIVKSVLGLLPVLLFLGGLVLLDSFKLVRLARVLGAIGVGCAAAMLAMLVNSSSQAWLQTDFLTYSRSLAPFVEESLKALYLVYLLRAHRIGFMVDAAILGFAIGAGFALVENLFYLYARPDAALSLWVIRGFGTAVMHGSATAIVGIVTKVLEDRREHERAYLVLPGLLVAVGIHWFYNHFFFSPGLSTVVILLGLPLLMVLVFRRSEDSTRHWLGVGFDTDRELLEMITTGTLGETRIGRYLHSLQDRFPPPVMVDMLCLLRLQLELAISAKGLLMMREAGFRVEPGPEVREKFQEMHFLQRSVGRTGILALRPFLHVRGRDLWQLHMLGGK